MVTLDVVGYGQPGMQNIFSIYHSLARVFPTLARHKCCEEWEKTPATLEKTSGVSLKTVGEVADIAHLTEHVIVDLVVAISSMKSCSGVTCGHKKPRNRFDLFIECECAHLGVFAANFAVYVVRHLFSRPRLSRRYAKVVEAARWLYENPDGDEPCELLTTGLGYPSGIARMVTNRMRIFQFFEKELA
jgi:hypothetical protein